VSASFINDNRAAPIKPRADGIRIFAAEGIYGIVPMVFGSLFVMFIAVSIALPIGLLAAIAISQIRDKNRRRVIKSALEILAGIPSIVYGLIGVAYVSLWVAGAFDLQSGRIILTAGLILAVMILPTFTPMKLMEP